MNVMAEFFYVVDENDNVIGRATREECHKSNRRIHRSVYIFVINSRDEIFLQRRSRTKDLYGGYYTGSATGHVDYGEDYDEAAQRELKEELGIEAPLTKVCKFKSFSNIEREISVLYTCHHNGPIGFSEKEVSEGIFMSLNQIKEELGSGRKRFAYGFKVAFEKFLKNAKVIA